MLEMMAKTSEPIVLPQPRVPVNVRLATMEDLPFIDSLQKMHTKMVGWMPTKQLEQKIMAGHTLVAEQGQLSVVSRPLSVVGDCASSRLLTTNDQQLTTNASPATENGPRTTDTRIAYCIGHDQYFKRDDVGIIYQMNVQPGKQRGLVGGMLLKAMFERAAWGCKLFCCWCAQDIEANRFWEAMGFVPLAFRAGSREKGRVHIFWQRRIRRGDTTTPFWFPSQTSSGSIREDRLVLPIPPGTHWSEVKGGILPENPKLEIRNPKEGEKSKRKIPNKKLPVKSQAAIAMGGLRFVVAKEVVEKKARSEGTRREPRRKVKNDPRLVAAARELRDRWLEHVNGEQFALPMGKYDVGRELTGKGRPMRELDLGALAA